MQGYDLRIRGHVIGVAWVTEGKIPTTAVRRRISLFSRPPEAVRPDPLPDLLDEAGERERVGACGVQVRGDGQDPFGHARDRFAASRVRSPARCAPAGGAPRVATAEIIAASADSNELITVPAGDAPGPARRPTGPGPEQPSGRPPALHHDQGRQPLPPGPWRACATPSSTSCACLAPPRSLPRPDTTHAPPDEPSHAP